MNITEEQLNKIENGSTFEELIKQIYSCTQEYERCFLNTDYSKKSIKSDAYFALKELDEKLDEVKKVMRIYFDEFIYNI